MFLLHLKIQSAWHKPIIDQEVCNHNYDICKSMEKILHDRDIVWLRIPPAGNSHQLTKEQMLEAFALAAMLKQLKLNFTCFNNSWVTSTDGQAIAAIKLRCAHIWQRHYLKQDANLVHKQDWLWILLAVQVHQGLHTAPNYNPQRISADLRGAIHKWRHLLRGGFQKMTLDNRTGRYDSSTIQSLELQELWT